MSSDHQDSLQPPSATSDHQHHHPSSTTPAGSNLHSFTQSLLPQTPSPMTTPTNPNAVEPNSTPESLLAAALGRAIMNIPSTSFQDAITNPLIRTLSDADSSPNQDLPTTTPPKVPRNNNSLRRTLSDSITTDHEQTQKIRKTPIRRASSDPNDYQQPQKTRTTPPRVFTGKQSPRSERLAKLEDMLREIEQRCWEIKHSEDEANPNPNPNPNAFQAQPQDEIEECVSVERQKNGDVKVELTCSCCRRFEVLLNHNGYCFYRLT